MKRKEIIKPTQTRWKRELCRDVHVKKILENHFNHLQLNMKLVLEQYRCADTKETTGSLTDRLKSHCT